MNQQIPESQLILNTDGSIYHLNLLPEDLATTIITVGDPERVATVSKYFDSIEIKKQKREHTTHTGYIGNKRITVISTGMGTNSTDIVINELDALVNIDFKARQAKENFTQLEIIRLGTSGTVQPDIPLDSVLTANYCIGLDGLLNFYQHTLSQDEVNLVNQFTEQFPEILESVRPFAIKADEDLVSLFSAFAKPGITLTCSGFYGPQDRQLRLQPKINNFIAKLQRFKFHDLRATNLEMETSAIYGLGHILGHKCCSLNLLIANRANDTFSKHAAINMEKMIENALAVIAKN